MGTKKNPVRPGGYPYARFLNVSKVCDHTTLSVSEVSRRVAAGTFPRPVRIGQRRTVWVESEVIEWCEAQIASSRMAREGA